MSVHIGSSVATMVSSTLLSESDVETETGNRDEEDMSSACQCVGVENSETIESKNLPKMLGDVVTVKSATVAELDKW